MIERHFVVDTNLVISAALQVKSTSFQALERAVKGGILLQSTATIAELLDVFQRPKFDKYTSRQLRLRFLGELSNQMRLIQITTRIAICRDPKDDKFLELAVNGHAACIITGDQDLLTLHPFRLIPILSPRDFLNNSF
ncbi:MAG: putative toxin-antitoxin system toxin component, PIN family [Armatimonadetes bacterium]|nr:putative toxin-antitoxin system toxin component, PIN family [Anaerolineae bacterium]